MTLLTGFGAWDLEVGGIFRSQGLQDRELGTPRERHSGKRSIFLNGYS